MQRESDNYRTIFLQILAANVPTLSRILGAQWNGYEHRLKDLLRGIQPSDAAAPRVVDRIIKLSLASAREFSRQCLYLSRELAGGDATTQRSILRSTESATPSHRSLRLPDSVDELRTLADAARQFLAAIERVERSGQSPEPSYLSGPNLQGSKEQREITVSGYSHDGQPAQDFVPGLAYLLTFKVGQPSLHNLASGDKVVTDVPADGLITHWVVTSTAYEFIGADQDVELRKSDNTSIAEFDLLIPETGDSCTKTLRIVPRKAAGTLLADIYAISAAGQRELYREISISLPGTPTVTRDETVRSLRHVHLPTSHEWTRPPEHVLIVIVNGVAIVSTARVGPRRYDFIESFSANDTLIANAIDRIRGSLDLLRENHCEYLDNLAVTELVLRLSSRAWEPYTTPSNGWAPLPEHDDAYTEDFSKVHSSAELRSLAKEGYNLYNRTFPKQSRFRAVLDQLLPGSRIDIHWTDQSGPGFVSHVPWALMYTEPVDDSIAPNPELFLGLRFRIAPRAWTVQNSSVAIGDLDTARSIELLYWGDKPDDAVGQEARWQAAEYQAWKWSTRIPDPAAPDPKRQVLDALKMPSPSPVGVLYMYCHCSVGDGSKLLLRFGSTSTDTIDGSEMPQQTLVDAPLVFANACSTAEADAHRTNELEQSFFDRGARAFIGTETRVPVRLASKFAWLYFQFLYRRASADPIAAGEALTQARLFLWTQFRNIGGLFYSFTNQYDLYVASDKELHSKGRQ